MLAFIFSVKGTDLKIKHKQLLWPRSWLDLPTGTAGPDCRQQKEKGSCTVLGYTFFHGQYDDYTFSQFSKQC